MEIVCKICIIMLNTHEIFFKEIILYLSMQNYLTFAEKLLCLFSKMCILVLYKIGNKTTRNYISNPLTTTTIEILKICLKRP